MNRKKTHKLIIFILVPILVIGLIIFVKQKMNHDFILSVSNQSSNVDPVDIKISIDGEVIVNHDFIWATGHYAERFQLSLSKGIHEIYIESIKGKAELKEEFEVKDKHWASVDYWYIPEESSYNSTPRKFNFYLKDEPLGNID